MNELITGEQNEALEVSTLMSLKCSNCQEVVGFEGSRENFTSLLQSRGWRLGLKALCPKCTNNKVRKTLKSFQD